MSKINYRQCDCCGNTLNKDVRVKGFINGFCFWWMGVDICHKCFKKLKKIKFDDINSEKVFNEILEDKHFQNYKSDDALCSVYLEGVEDTLKRCVTANIIMRTK